MTKENRRAYEFAVDDKFLVRDRAGIGLKTGELAGGKCQFPGDNCFAKPEYKVSHLTSCFEARLDHKDRRAIREVSQNGLLQCKMHNAFLDAQQSFQFEMLLAERFKKRGGLIYQRSYEGEISEKRKLGSRSVSSTIFRSS